MEELSQLHIIGIIFTLFVIIGIGIYSGKKVKNIADFSTGGHKATATLVAGAIIGTLVGGSSTIGTAQLAYTYGISAWWFTIGSGIGCLLLGAVFIKPLRNSNCNTIQQMITNEYGQFSGVLTSVLASFGIMINIVAQILAANALLTSMFSMSPFQSAAISVVLMACYVIFGGVLGTGVLGIIKLLLIYISVIFGAIVSLKLSNGLSSYINFLEHHQYFNLIGRGFGIDVGAGFSVALGVLSTQTYIQAVLSGRSDKAAKHGALASAILIPPIGLGSIFIGMYMQIAFPNINPGHAFPLFVIRNIPPLIGGVILATLLIALVGTGAGMALGFGTIFTNDIYKRYINKECDEKNELFITRLVIIISLLVSAIFTLGNLGSTILTWGFMSMGLRATVLIMPMIGSLFLKGKINNIYANLSSIFGLIAFVICEIFFELAIDSLFIGVGVSFLVIIFAFIKKTKSKSF